MKSGGNNEETLRFFEGQPNPYARLLKKQVTIRLDESTIEHFKSLAAETGIRYQTLINLYLRECAAKRKRLSNTWMSPGK
jgi:uncharacterized protein (DUF4415 family)